MNEKREKYYYLKYLHNSFIYPNRSKYIIIDGVRPKIDIFFFASQMKKVEICGLK